jgi:Exodeoxyribonuclease VII large subunit (EC 3.1.11.6)
VVTSPAGAAFHDITRAIHQRWPARIVLAPTLVQGAEAPAQIVKALQAIQRVRGLHVVILGRGGGASEDLAAFNDERVVRGTELEFVIMVIAVSCVKLLSAHNSTQHTSRKHKV